MNLMAGLRKTIVLALSALAISHATLAPAAKAQESHNWRIGIATVGTLKYAPGFAHFDYVNPDAPKGGTLRLSQSDTFDSLNPVLAKGDVGIGLGDVYETLLKPSLDEISSSYGLLAESLNWPDDFSSVTFRLRAEAKWEDGKPVTPEDVVFSFDKAKELSPRVATYYSHVVKAEKTGERDVTFLFNEKNNRELPHIVGQLQIVPKHWWEGTGIDGKPRDISRTTLEPVMGSGPYKMTKVIPGSRLRYERRSDYWGKDLNVNRGTHNFDVIEYTYYSDRNVEFEAFRGDETDYWAENEAKRWATAYDFPAVQDGRIKREILDNDYRASGVMVGFIPNMRREKFRDIRVRKALSYAFDFEQLNKTIFFGQYERINSYFFGSELASSGLPEGRELAILNEVRDLVPPEVFTQEFRNPVGGNPKSSRDNLRTALTLFQQAGYELRKNRMVNAKTGEPFRFEIMLNSPIIERVALPFAQNLKKIGVEVTVRPVDPSQFTNRWRSRDYDVIYDGWGESLNPGNEQAEYWGSKAAATEGSQNYAGIADKAVDILVSKVIFAKDRAELVASVKALDRLLLHNYFVVPSYTLRKSRLAYWDRFNRPAQLPTYSVGFPDIWWSKSAEKP
jgi:microcin C transport system substrate-binding protein